MRPFVAALALLLVACGGAPDHPLAEVVDSAGIALVWNRGADVPLEWTFEPVVTVGGEEDGPEAFYQVGRAVDVDSAGNLYVLDRGNHRVVVFDSHGGYVRTMGRKGGGPGEVEWPQNIVVWAGGQVDVADFSKRGLVRFDADGGVLGQRVLEGWSGAAIARIGEGLAVERQRREGEGAGEVRHEEIVLFGDTSSHVLVSIQMPTLQPMDFGCVRFSGMPALFAPSLVWAASGDRVAVAPAAEYVVDIYEGGERVASVRRDVPLTSVTRELAVKEMGDSMTVRFGAGGGCSIPADEVVEKRGYADVVPAVSRMEIAPDGTLWISRRAVRGEPRPTDLFTARGHYLGTLPPGAPFPAAFTPDGGLVAVERDELDVPRVVVYRIVHAEIATP